MYLFGLIEFSLFEKIKNIIKLIVGGAQMTKLKLIVSEKVFSSVRVESKKIDVALSRTKWLVEVSHDIVCSI